MRDHWAGFSLVAGAAVDRRSGGKGREINCWKGAGASELTRSTSSRKAPRRGGKRGRIVVS